jgi:hypothetical protein
MQMGRKAIERPFISIVMPLYNKEAEVKRSVESVLAQTFTEFELIVVNDGSTDRGAELVRGFADDRIKVYDQDNQGVSAARNKGIDVASSDLIAFLDGDDLWEPDFLKSIILLKKNFPICSVFATCYSYLEDDGAIRYPVLNGLPQNPWKGILEDYFTVASLSDPPLWTSAVAVKRDTIREIGGFPLGMKSGEDLLTWARLAVRQKIAYDTRPLAVFRQRASRSDHPTRVPDCPDNVGRELGRLKDTISPERSKSLCHYIAWWHKNRANMYLRLNSRKNACYEVLQMGRNRLDSKFFIYVVCLVAPFVIIRKLFSLWEKR